MARSKFTAMAGTADRRHALVDCYGRHRRTVARSNWLLWPTPQADESAGSLSRTAKQMADCLEAVLVLASLDPKLIAPHFDTISVHLKADPQLQRVCKTAAL